MIKRIKKWWKDYNVKKNESIPKYLSGKNKKRLDKDTSFCYYDNMVKN